MVVKTTSGWDVWLSSTKHHTYPMKCKYIVLAIQSTRVKSTKVLDNNKIDNMAT